VVSAELGESCGEPRPEETTTDSQPLLTRCDQVHVSVCDARRQEEQKENKASAWSMTSGDINNKTPPPARDSGKVELI
jgi:hypothetical protein